VGHNGASQRTTATNELHVNACCDTWVTEPGVISAALGGERALRTMCSPQHSSFVAPGSPITLTSVIYPGKGTARSPCHAPRRGSRAVPERPVDARHPDPRLDRYGGPSRHALGGHQADVSGLGARCRSPLPRYLLSVSALAIPSRCRSSMTPRSNCATLPIMFNIGRSRHTATYAPHRLRTSTNRLSGQEL
jgi:hypothetical protein